MRAELILIPENRKLNIDVYKISQQTHYKQCCSLIIIGKIEVFYFYGNMNIKN